MLFFKEDAAMSSATTIPPEAGNLTFFSIFALRVNTACSLWLSLCFLRKLNTGSEIHILYRSYMVSWSYAQYIISASTTMLPARKNHFPPEAGVCGPSQSGSRLHLKSLVWSFSTCIIHSISSGRKLSSAHLSFSLSCSHLRVSSLGTPQ